MVTQAASGLLAVLGVALVNPALAQITFGSPNDPPRIALGGVSTVPWRAAEAEAGLRGKTIDNQTAKAAADAAFAGAKGRGHNDFKIELGKRTLHRALLQGAALEI